MKQMNSALLFHLLLFVYCLHWGKTIPWSCHIDMKRKWRTFSLNSQRQRKTTKISYVVWPQNNLCSRAQAFLCKDLIHCFLYCFRLSVFFFILFSFCCLHKRVGDDGVMGSVYVHVKFLFSAHKWHIPLLITVKMRKRSSK